MSKDYSFSVMPSVSISRSRFARKSQHKTSFNLGQIIPIYCDEVLPGDTRSLDMASLVRMSTPIAPIMDNIYMDYYAFFVPARLTWVHWKEFMGENSVSAGIPASTYTIPTVVAAAYSSSISIDKNSYADYMGLPVGVNNLLHNISALPFRGLALIYNRWFRNENIIAPLAVDTSDTSGIIVGSSYNFAADHTKVLNASKLPDYFTKGLPYAQKGAAVSVPLGTTAPIIASGDLKLIGANDTGNGTALKAKADSSSQSYVEIINPGAGVTPDGNLRYKSGLSVDLGAATAATINTLRYAFQLQKFLEKDALYGTRYWEILAAHFGVTAPDASLQDPEYLGGFRQQINIDQVLSTAGYDDTAANQEVGKPGASSVTGGKSSLFTKSFCEHGFIYVVAVARHDQTYTNGINRMWSRSGRYDFYWPVFANLGAQEIKKKEIFAQGTSTDDEVFAYQEAWAEYRYKPSIATGSMRPTSGNLTYWTLANNFATLPTLGQTFIEQGRENIVRALVTGLTGPDFICDFYFQDIAVRPMPLYSIPGLIDHH